MRRMRRERRQRRRRRRMRAYICTGLALVPSMVMMRG